MTGNQGDPRPALSGQAGEALVELGTGETRRVMFNNRRLQRLEREFGSLQELCDLVVRQPFHCAGVMLAVGLGGTCTPDQALDLLDGRPVVTETAPQLLAAVMAAYGIEPPATAPDSPADGDGPDGPGEALAGTEWPVPAPGPDADASSPTGP